MAYPHKRATSSYRSGSAKKQRTMSRKLARIPLPEVLTTVNDLATTLDTSTAFDIDVTNVGAGVGDPGRTGSQLQVSRLDWLINMKAEGSFAQSPIRCTIYSLKDDATGISDVDQSGVYDENVYNVYKDFYINPGNNWEFATHKGSLKITKNLRFFGNNEGDHVTPPIRMRLTQQGNGSRTQISDADVQGYARLWFYDK